MTTIFEKCTNWKKKLLYHSYAYVINSTEIGVYAAASISMSVATDINVDEVVRDGALAVTCYLVPAVPLYMYVHKADRVVSTGKKAVRYGGMLYKFARKYTSPVEFVNYLALKGITKLGVTEVMKNYCNVLESDVFHWERSNITDILT